MSLITMPFGLTEPLFVPEYWMPPSLFDLAEKIGFDIESLIFSFAIGGIGTVLYNIIFKRGLAEIPHSERSHNKHRLHIYILFTPVILFILLSLFTSLNHIYCGIIGLFIGGLATLYCRPDLKVKIWVGGILFTVLYFIYFGSILPFYPQYVELYWNLDNLTHILVLGIPIEELLFAFTFGMFWSGLYEHIYWRKLIKSNKTSNQFKPI
ncbi:lycopene cyclase domain-containing protein [Sediminibacter sp. Hel_I_10]|uniref:lycopene cyclase domain-containing protein n=1 Tax=Sediminibacter sp. Hel_I_10 TaxID=1392490 RepID=UPI001E2932BD|nr:lycopene cyclase domain-containing protein [Sediminibacter sp. Hel_I_10]